MSTNARRLAKAVRERREELDLTQLEVWQAGGPSNTTLTAIESGEAATLVRATARKLDVGLQWAPGTARAVFDGSEPPQQVARGTDSLEKLRADLAAIQQRLADLEAERAGPVDTSTA